MELLLDGKLCAHHFYGKLGLQVETISHMKVKPHLAIVMLGNDERSSVYVKAKIRACEQLGFHSTLKHFPSHISQEHLEKQIQQLNNDKNISGIIIQLPLPSSIDERKICNIVNPEKDVDGFSQQSIGSLILGMDTFIPATPLGILMMLDFYQIKTEGKYVVVMGRSNIVGRPLSIILSQKHRLGNATVTLCHSYTHHISTLTQQADILIVALGQANLIKADDVKKNAIVIDVGINTIQDVHNSKMSLVGDVDFENVKHKTFAISPVPGGVGKMTIVALMCNTLKAFIKQHEINHLQPIFSLK